MNFVLSGVTGMRNRGVEALVRPVVDRLLTQFAPARVTVLTGSPDYDAQRLPRPEVEFVTDGLTGAGQGTVRRLRQKTSRFCTRLAPGFQTARARVQAADALIASGGDVFSSDYGAVFPHLSPLEVALRAGVPFVLLAHTIGPFKTKQESDAWMRVAGHAALITIRGPLSFRYVTQDLGLPAHRVHETADVAFLLEPAFPAPGSSWRQVYRLDDRAPLIAVAPSQGIVRYAGVDAERHLRTWRAVITMLVRELGAEVILVPHVQEVRAANDDRILATALAGQLHDLGRVTLAGWDHSAAEFKGIISECALAIAERMHACIAALGSGVPTLAVGYSLKAEGTMQSIFGDAREELSVLTSIERFLDPTDACATARTCWSHRDRIRAILLERREELRRRASANFTLLQQALGGRQPAVQPVPQPMPAGSRVPEP